MSHQLGLRERKKQRTRQHIADTALGLFLERGFDAVTVVEVARAADVAEKTVYNYFPTKEDLVYSRMETFATALLDAMRNRKPGESVLDAFGRFVLEPPYGLLGDHGPNERLTRISRMISDSPALLAREQQVFARYTAALADLLAEETRAGADDVEPWVAANALMGVHRALVQYVRRHTLAGTSAATLTRNVRAQGRAALATLAHGLGSYGVRAPD